MKKSKKNTNWEITIVATIKKTIKVRAKNQEEAITIAHESFSVLNDENPEKYNQEIVEIHHLT